VNPLIFISYRREDSAAQAGRLRATLLGQFGEQAVFMDTSSIQPGMEWPARIADALDSAQVVVVVLGPGWIRVSEESGQRRIDLENDWVRRELEEAFTRKKEIFPVLVSGARIPPADWLPKSLAELPTRQALEIRDGYWDHDVKLLMRRLETLDKVPQGKEPVGDYPSPGAVLPDPISDEMLETALRKTLKRWKKVVSPRPDKPDSVRIELFREYKFKTFIDAISFMSEVAPGCNIAIHHPRWENVWKTVKVYLTTWDIDHRISDRDVQLAQYFEKAYSEFPGADP